MAATECVAVLPNNAENDDFSDPLGVKDPNGSELDAEQGEFVISPFKPPVETNTTNIANELARISLENDLQNEIHDLSVAVDNPEKHATAMESFITFRVITKTTRCEFENRGYEVRRRYNDFLWLRQRLEETQPTHLVPPLPEKHSLNRLERFSQSFVKTRTKALQAFLSRVSDHPILSFNTYFCTFLTAKQAEFQAAKKEGSSGFISRWADSFHNISASYMMKNRPAEFTSMSDYVVTFSEKLNVIDRILQRITKEQCEYAAELNELGPIFTLWSNSEDRLQHALAAMAKAIEKNYVALQTLVDGCDAEFSQPMHEYSLYVDSIKAVLRRRDAIQMEYEMVLEELNRKKDEKDEASTTATPTSIGTFFGADPQQAKINKIEKLDLQIDQLQHQVECQNDRTACCDSDLKADMERWHKMKRADLRHVFVQFADRQIVFYEKCLASWEEAIPQIQRTDHGHVPDVAPVRKGDGTKEPEEERGTGNEGGSK